MADYSKSLTGHSVGKEDWETPQEIHEYWDDIFMFDVDVCASIENRKHPKFYAKDDLLCGLARKWHQDGEKFWMNPPYGRGIIEKWVKKASEEAEKGCLVVGLLPVSTSSRWWQQYVTKADYIYYYPKRLKFGEAKGNASFDNAIIIWGLDPRRENAV